MKKYIKKIELLFFIMLVMLGLSSCFLAPYSENSDLIGLYNNNKSALQNVIDENGDTVGSISTDKTKNINIKKIFSYGDYTCFEVHNDYWYQVIVYSKDNKFIEKVPFERGSELINNKKFEELDDNTRLKGKANNGEDWFLVRKIEENWFYYEFHEA